MFDLSLPALKLDSPRLAAGSVLQLSARTVDGSAVSADRVPGLALKAATNAGLPLGLWSTLTNSFFLSEGLANVTNVGADPPGQFFILSEPK